VPAAVPPTQPALSVLLVAQLTPPSPLSAARRAAGLVKYLERLGHRVTVLTSLSSGRGSVPGAARVVRTRDLLVSRINWRRASFEALSGGGDAGYSEPSPIAAMIVPDLAIVGWLPFVLPRALSLARRERFDCVITTSPPHSAHLVGLALRRRGIPWVADFRDGWTFESDRQEWPLQWQRALDHRLERAVGEGADALVAVTQPIADDLGRRFRADVATITNGFDPEEHRTLQAEEPPDLAADRYSLLHAGRMAYAGRSPRPLLEAVEQLRIEDPAVAERLELVFAGPLSGDERELIERPSLDGSTRAVGSLDRARTLALEQQADALLVITSGHRRGEATQKVFEYLATGKPVLVLGEDTEAARIVTEAGGGIVTSASDPDRIAASLRELVEELDAGATRTPRIERFSYASLAAAMAEQVQRARRVAASSANTTRQ
jgi:glycosyltransferase involved in cell wall biosynthesis